MRTRTQKVLSQVAVPAQDLEPVREPLLDQPSVNLGSSDLAAVGGSVAVDVIDSEKHGLGFAAAGAVGTVMSENLCLTELCCALTAGDHPTLPVSVPPFTIPLSALRTALVRRVRLATAGATQPLCSPFLSLLASGGDSILVGHGASVRVTNGIGKVS